MPLSKRNQIFYENSIWLQVFDIDVKCVKPRIIFWLDLNSHSLDHKDSWLSVSVNNKSTNTFRLIVSQITLLNLSSQFYEKYLISTPAL